MSSIDWNKPVLSNGKANDAQNVQAMMELAHSRIVNELPKYIDNATFIKFAVDCMLKNKALLECSQMSILGALLESARMGLMPGDVLGLAYIIPYKGKAQFQLGYKGLINLVRRTGKVRSVIANEVCDGDTFDYFSASEGVYNHQKRSQNREENITHFYAIIKYSDGGEDFAIMSKMEVDAHKEKFSKTYKIPNSPWVSNYVSMGKKTALIKACAYAEMSLSSAESLNLQRAMDLQGKMDIGKDQMLDFNLMPTKEDTDYQEMTDNISASAQAYRANEEKENAQLKTEQKAKDMQDSVDKLAGEAKSKFK